MKLIIFRKTWAQMSAVSGYDPLFPAISRYVDGGVQDFMVTAPRGDFASRAKRYLQRRVPRFSAVQRTHHPLVDKPTEAVAKQLIRAAEEEPGARILLMAGESQLGLEFAEASDSIRKRTVMCMHQPPSWLRLNFRDFSTLDGLAAIICLSSEQKKFVESVCSTPVILSRHGVRHDFFQPGESRPAGGDSRLLIVGEWFRDFDLLLASMNEIWSNAPETTLDIVLRHSAREMHPVLYKLARDSRVRWHADISAEKLRSLYQEATLLYLPLVDAAANNAIGEAMACGLPVVSTSVGGTPDYVSPETGELCTVDSTLAHAATVLKWMRDPERRLAASLAGRKFAEDRLDWQSIARELVDEFKKLGL